ncbi:hypothetical protein SK128_024298 [Halocaridina rubra]|uniref:Uncharacterized protein n=1 Tax=Halocaridina rubra TaxID=373956 RepID=A0AAN9A2L2_HALRR
MCTVEPEPTFFVDIIKNQYAISCRIKPRVGTSIPMKHLHSKIDGSRLVQAREFKLFTGEITAVTGHHSGGVGACAGCRLPYGSSMTHSTHPWVENLKQ